MGQQTISAAIPWHFIHIHNHRHMARYTLACLLCQFSPLRATIFSHIYHRFTRAFSRSATRPHATKLLGQMNCPLANSSRYAQSELARKGVRLSTPMRTAWTHDSGEDFGEETHWAGCSVLLEPRSQYLQFEAARRRISTPLRLHSTVRFWERHWEKCPKRREVERESTGA